MGSFYVAAVEGDWCDRLDAVARAWDKRPVGPVRLFANWASVAPHRDEEGCLVAALCGGWTVLANVSLSCDLVGDARSASLPARLSTRVVGAFGDDGAGQYFFRLCAPAGVLRSVYDTDGEVAEDTGDPLPGEEPCDGYGVLDILDLLRLLGIDVADGVEASTRTALLRYADGRASGSAP